MEILLVLGLFLLTHQGLAQNVVLTVNPLQVEAKRGDAIELDCQGNTKDLLVYISNRINWKHVAHDGTSHKITTGFYLDADTDKTRYAITYGPAEHSDINYSFRLKILNVTDNDDGKYVCENEDNKRTIVSSKEVQFTVLNPVVKVELYMLSISSSHNIHSETQIMPNSEVHKVEKGDYEVTCTAEGSNPKPQMTLKFNNNTERVETAMEKSFVGNRPSFKGMLRKVFSLNADKHDVQKIECSTVLPGRQFPDKYAGLQLMIFSEENPVRATCHTMFANKGERDVTAVCNIITPDCSSIRWEGKWQGPTLAAMERRVDNVLGVLESTCKKLEGNTGIEAVLKISNVTEAIFQANIYMSYNNGVEPVRVSIQIEKRGTNAPHGNSGTEPLEIGIFVVMMCAVISVSYE